MGANKVSIKDIAQMAGVSVATVSRVINQNGRFSKETEKRVLDIINEYEYRPNELARGLRVDKSQVIGVIVPDITHEFFSQIARNIETELLKYGYMAIICDTNEKEEMEKQYMEMLSSMRVGGIIYIGGDPIVEPIKDIPIVYVDRPPVFENKKSGTCFIGSNNFQGGYLAAECLINSGKKEIVMVIRSNNNLDAENIRSRMEGFKQALRDHGFTCGSDRIIKVAEVGMKSGYEAAKRICETRPEVNGIFFYSDILAIGGLKYLNEAGYEIPKEMAVVGMDDIPVSSMATPALTTVRQAFDQFGNLAVRSIMKMLSGNKEEQKYILSVKLIKRDTV